MSDFTAFTDPETAYKAGIGQDFMRKMKDNFDNLNARINKLNNRLGFFEDFNFAPRPSGVAILPYGFEAISPTTFSYPSFSVLRVSSGNSNPGAGLVLPRPMNFASVGKPIRCKARVKRGTDTAFRFGFQSIINMTDSIGVWLERVDASNWRFAAYDGTRESGVSFANVATGTWFDFEIVLTDTPSDRALCYLNGVLKDTLTTHPPVTGDMWGLFNWDPNAASENYDFDYVDWDADARIDAA